MWPPLSKLCNASPLQIQRTRINHTGLGRVAAFDAANLEELFATALQVRLHFLDVRRRDNQNHAHTEIERLQQGVGIQLSHSSPIEK